MEATQDPVRFAAPPVKLPLNIRKDLMRPEGMTPVCDADGEAICFFFQDADARQFINAVNVHDALVKRIEILGRMIEKATGWTLTEIAEQVAVIATPEAH